MSPDRVAGVGLLPAPATLPDRPGAADVDAELVDLLCEDEVWLEETFREIVAASWVEPPRGGVARPAARPRRRGLPGRRRSRDAGQPASQWTTPPRGRQRSPPRRAGA